MVAAPSLVSRLAIMTCLTMPSRLRASPFGEFQDHVAGEPVADHHVRVAGGDVPGLDVAHKPDGGVGFQPLVGLFYTKGCPLVSSAPLFTSATAGLATPMTLFIYTLPITPKASSMAGRHSHVGAAVHEQVGLFWRRG